MYMGQCYTTYNFLYDLLVKIILNSNACNTNINSKTHLGTMPMIKLEKFFEEAIS